MKDCLSGLRSSELLDAAVLLKPRCGSPSAALAPLSLSLIQATCSYKASAGRGHILSGKPDISKRRGAVWRGEAMTLSQPPRLTVRVSGRGMKH
jgi:hypothetical protein